MKSPLRAGLYDLGHGICLCLGRQLVFKAHFPFPLTVKGWKYIVRNRHAG